MITLHDFGSPESSRAAVDYPVRWRSREQVLRTERVARVFEPERTSDDRCEENDENEENKQGERMVSNRPGAFWKVELGDE